MSTATRLGNRGGQRHVGKQAEAGGACSSEHGSCWSHAELCPSILRGVHPWDPLARPSVHPWWSRGCCAPTPPADVTSAWEGPVATHRRLPGPSRRSASFAHIYIPSGLLLLYGGSMHVLIVCMHLTHTASTFVTNSGTSHHHAPQMKSRLSTSRSKCSRGALALHSGHAQITLDSPNTGEPAGKSKAFSSGP